MIDTNVVSELRRAKPAQKVRAFVGGQAGDTEGLSREESVASESVEELAEEGQAYEASVVDAIENAPNADQGEIRTRQVPEDDVPQEYLDGDSPTTRSGGL